MLVKRLTLCTAIVFGIVLTTAVAPRAAERSADDGPQWPNITAEEPQWPNLRVEDINPHPAFVDPQAVEDRIMGRKRNVASKPAPAAAADGLDANASVDARWPALVPVKAPPPAYVKAPAPAYVIEADLSDLDAALDAMLGDDPMAELRKRTRNYYLGEIDADHYADTFVEAVRRYL